MPAHLYSLNVHDPSASHVVASIERQPKDTLIEVQFRGGAEAVRFRIPHLLPSGDLEDDGVSFTPTSGCPPELAIRQEVLDQRERELIPVMGCYKRLKKNRSKNAELKNLQQAIDQLLNQQ